MSAGGLRLSDIKSNMYNSIKLLVIYIYIYSLSEVLLNWFVAGCSMLTMYASSGGVMKRETPIVRYACR
jgi:hypothetical protein